MTDSSVDHVPEVAVYRHQAELIRRRVRRNLEGLSHEGSLVQPKPGGHSTNWVLWHLIEIYERTLRRLGQERVMQEGALEPYRQGLRQPKNPPKRWIWRSYSRPGTRRAVGSMRACAN